MNTPKLYYGVFKPCQKIRTFVAIDLWSAPRKDILEIYSENITREEAKAKAKTLAQKYKKLPTPEMKVKREVWNKPQKPKQTTIKEPQQQYVGTEETIHPTLEPGRVALHDDGRKKHVAVILQIKNNRTKALFFTSNPHWGTHSRKAKKEEIAHVGFIPTKTTYLTSVIRNSHEFAPMTAKIPQDYLLQYHQEFPNSQG